MTQAVIFLQAVLTKINFQRMDKVATQGLLRFALCILFFAFPSALSMFLALLIDAFLSRPTLSAVAVVHL